MQNLPLVEVHTFILFAYFKIAYFKEEFLKISFVGLKFSATAVNILLCHLSLNFQSLHLC